MAAPALLAIAQRPCASRRAYGALQARSKAPLLMRIKVDSPMELGADIHWLSLFPNEEEVLFPPLTFLKPMFKQNIRNSVGTVVTVKPSFPS